MSEVDLLQIAICLVKKDGRELISDLYYIYDEQSCLGMMESAYVGDNVVLFLKKVPGEEYAKKDYLCCGKYRSSVEYIPKDKYTIARVFIFADREVKQWFKEEVCRPS